MIDSPVTTPRDGQNLCYVKQTHCFAFCYEGNQYQKGREMSINSQEASKWQ